MADPRVVEHANLMDIGAVSVAFGSWLEHLPAAASAMSVLWLGIQMWESPLGTRTRARVRAFLLRRGPF